MTAPRSDAGPARGHWVYVGPFSPEKPVVGFVAGPQGATRSALAARVPDHRVSQSGVL